MTPDLYPSRTPDTRSYAFLPRIDPVAWNVPGTLSSFERASYETNGYLVMPDFAGGEELDELRAEVADTSAFEFLVREPDSDVVRSAFAVHHGNGALADMSRDARLLAIVGEIVGHDPYVHQSRVNYKAPMAASGWRWHSDFETWHVEDGMPLPRCVTAMIALSDNVESNGPLMVIPGSHRRYLACPGETPDGNFAQHLADQRYGVPDVASLLEFVREAGDRIDSLVCRAGALVLFDCNLMHGSNSNLTPWARTNLFYAFNARANAIGSPFCGRAPRPEHVATRAGILEAA